MRHLAGAVRFLVGILGAAVVLVAVFATRLGLDHNPEWGPGRQRLLAAGLALLAGSLWPRLQGLFQPAEQTLRATWQRIRLALSGSSGGRFLLGLSEVIGEMLRRMISVFSTSLEVSWLSWRSRNRLAALLALGAVVGAEIVYVFIVSVGSWSTWPEETGYYHLLSDAFRAGQVHLLIEPDPSLVALNDPYDVASREGVAYLSDAIYYEGKYYLYWGPAPALALAVAEVLTGQALGDQYLTFILVSVVNVFLAWILYDLWRRLFNDTSPFLLAVAVIAAALAGPIPWLLGRPAIYEAAIAGGQAFFLLGLAMLLPELVEGRSSPGRLVMAGVAWALAVGSRVSLAPAVVLLAGWLILHWLRARPVPGGSLVAFLLPLAVGGLAPAWYNWIRFDNALDTGLGHMLTIRDLHRDAADVFSLSYIPSNLFNHLWMPLRGLSVFPFVKPQWGILSVPLLGIRPGGLYGTEHIAGVLRTTPLVWLSLYPGVAALVRWTRQRRDPQAASTRVAVIFALGFAGTFAVLVAFFFATMRYQVDFVPALYLLAVVGGWMAIRDFRRRSERTWIPTIAVGFLALWGMAVGILMAITGYDTRFEFLNPALFDQLTRFFAR